MMSDLEQTMEHRTMMTPQDQAIAKAASVLPRYLGDSVFVQTPTKPEQMVLELHTEVFRIETKATRFFRTPKVLTTHTPTMRGIRLIGFTSTTNVASAVLLSGSMDEINAQIREHDITRLVTMDEIQRANELLRANP